MSFVEDWEATIPGGMKGWNSFEQEFVVQAAAEADVSFDRVGLLTFQIDLVPIGSKDRDDRDNTDFELDTFPLILRKFRSATEVCNFCQSFSSAHKKCKIIFDTTAHRHRTTRSDVSLQQICSIGALESRLHELIVKYQGLPLFFKDRPKIQDHWLETAQENLMDHEIIWTQKIFLEHVTKYLSGLLDEASSAMGLFFVELGLPQKLLEMRVNGRQTIAEINRATDKLIALPSKAEFKDKLMKKFFHKYEKRLALLGFNSPAGAVSLILNGEAVDYETEPEYIKWIQAIMRAWDL
ncbi:hypothetical protein BKA69DRAFT_1107125 [Paraphysoderma sedebokerense]|nr:hypothetical protein BKA69DRAFT_1107125 [Paraphysoderma sedebokerense]